MREDTTATFKLLLIGDSNVGKSSILIRLCDDTFLPAGEISATIGVDFKAKVIEIDDKKYRLTIWDTAGQERFRTLTSSYYRGAHGIILVYDVTNRETFEHLDNWFEEIERYCGNQDVIKMVVGNKVDQGSKRMISTEEGINLAKKNNTLFMECSAKTKVGIQIAAEDLVRKIIDSSLVWQKQQTNSNSIVVSNEQQHSQSWCFC